MNNEEYFYHNLRDMPLKLRTSSKIGSGDLVCFAMREDANSLNGQIGICIEFGGKISIKILVPDPRCKPNTILLQTQSKTDDRMWSILKTSTSFQISGDDFKELNIPFAELDCGSMAKSTNFGWLESITRLGDFSTAFYFVENKGKLREFVKSSLTIRYYVLCHFDPYFSIQYFLILHGRLRAIID